MAVVAYIIAAVFLKFIFTSLTFNLFLPYLLFCNALLLLFYLSSIIWAICSKFVNSSVTVDMSSISTVLFKYHVTFQTVAILPYFIFLCNAIGFTINVGIFSIFTALFTPSVYTLNVVISTASAASDIHALAIPVDATFRSTSTPLVQIVLVW